MTGRKAKYIFDNGYEKSEHYLYGLRDSSGLLTIVNECGKDPHLVYNFHDMSGIWGAIDELMNGMGEEMSDKEIEDLQNKWIKQFNIEQPRYYYPKNDHYYRFIEECRMKDPTTGEWYDAIIYVNDMTDKPKYIREKEDFLKKFQKCE